jgi:hypothetical protein
LRPKDSLPASSLLLRGNLAANVQRKLAPLYVVVGMKGRRLRVGSALLTHVREVVDFQFVLDDRARQ